MSKSINEKYLKLIYPTDNEGMKDNQKHISMEASLEFHALDKVTEVRMITNNDNKT